MLISGGEGGGLYLQKCQFMGITFSRGSLSNDDGNINENSKKAIGLDWQNNNFACDHPVLYISLPSLHDYDVKMPNFTFCGGCKHKTMT